jgi:hypothetical protein
MEGARLPGDRRHAKLQPPWPGGTSMKPLERGCFSGLISKILWIWMPKSSEKYFESEAGRGPADLKQSSGLQVSAACNSRQTKGSTSTVIACYGLR